MLKYRKNGEKKLKLRKTKDKTASAFSGKMCPTPFSCGTAAAKLWCMLYLKLTQATVR